MKMATATQTQPSATHIGQPGSSPLQKIAMGMVIVIGSAYFPADPSPSWEMYDALAESLAPSKHAQGVEGGIDFRLHRLGQRCRGAREMGLACRETRT